jgi:hypothetical protein
VSLDVSGQADYTWVGEFFDRIGRLPLIVELESLSLDATPGGAVRFAARLGFPCYTGWPPEPPRPEPARPAGTGPLTDERAAYQQALFEQRDLLRRMAEEARAPLGRLQAKEIIAMGEMRTARAPARFHAALARLEAFDGRAVAFSRAPRPAQRSRWPWRRPRAALRPAFEGGLRGGTLDVAAAGDCRAFSVTARLAPPKNRARSSRPGGRPRPFPRRARGVRRRAQPSKGDVSVRGTAGDISVRVREIDLADVFNLLAKLTRASFVVDADVKGRVSVDLDRATLDQALAALGSTGVVVGPGPLRRVARAGGTPPAALRPASREEPISLSLTNAVLLDVLRLFEHITGCAAWTAPVADGRVSVFATEVPWDAILDGIAASVGMTAVIEGDRFFVSPRPWRAPGARARLRPRAPDDRRRPAWTRIVQLKKMGVDDLTPVGMAGTAGAMKAVAYGPGRLCGCWSRAPSCSTPRCTPWIPPVTFAAPDGRKTAVRFTP